MTHSRPRLAVFKFASCDGCQLSLLDCEDELLAVAGAVDIAHFPEATRHSEPGPYDVALVEGSVTTPHDRERILEVRKDAKVLVTLGACATAGGVQALRNGRDVKEFVSLVYARPQYIDTLATSTAIAAHVPVDYELRGCPIDRSQLLELLTALLHGKRPHLPNESVCLECKRHGVPCIMVTEGTPCLGPVTHTGCGALCPRFNRPCYGCFGPKDRANAAALATRAQALGWAPSKVGRLFGTFNVGAAPFDTEYAKSVEASGSTQ